MHRHPTRDTRRPEAGIHRRSLCIVHYALCIAFAAAFAANASARDLPEAFLEYVEATGAQRVLTDYRSTGDTFVQAVFTPTDVSTAGYLFRSGRTSQPSFNFRWAAKGAATQDYDMAAFGLGGLAAGVTYTLDAGNFTATIYSNDAAIATADIGHSVFKSGGITLADKDGGYFLLFAFHRYAYNDFNNTYAKVRLHSFRVCEREKGAVVMKREFLPCLKDGVAQLYDTVTGAFFANATATPLVAGPTIGTDCFVVARTAEVGAQTPVCGVHATSAGDPLTLETTASIADASGRAVWNCAGYTLAYADGTETTGTGNSISFNYAQPFVLTWNYERVRTIQDSVTWYVAPLAAGEARTAPTGTTTNNAFFQPKHALQVADAGDTVLLAPGTYPLLKTLTIDKVITLTSTDGAETTVLDGVAKAFRIMSVTTNATVEGVTIARGGGNGSNDNLEAGRGLRVSGGGLVRDCIISNNTAGSWCRGAGVHIAYGTVSRCLIANNTIGSYAGAGAGVCGAKAVLEHCLITNNVGGASASGGGVFINEGLIRNCTIVANEANKAGGINFDNSKARCIDTIVYGNRVLSDASSGAPNWFVGNVMPKLTNVFSAVAIGTDTTGGRLSGDPFFASFDGGDYRLTPSSPCLDAAWGEATVATDLDGNNRVSGPAMDIGCFEYDQSQVSASFGFELDEDAGEVVLSATAVGFNLAEAVCYWSISGVEPTPSANDATGSPATLSLAPGEYSVGCAIYLDGAKVYSEVKPALFRIRPARLFVDAACATPTPPYQTWATAATNVLDAVDWARSGSVVTVARGTYPTTRTIRLDEGFTLVSRDGPEATFLDGGKSHRVVHVNHARAFVAGFAIQNGRYGLNLSECGAGVYIAGGVVSNCIVRGNDNTTSIRCYGGGAVVSGGLMTGCIVTNNSITSDICSGGGLWVSGSGVVENTLVAHNACSAGAGGARMSGHMRNCTITANTGRDPAFYNEYSSGSAVNTIIYGNTATGASVTNPDFNAVPAKATNVWSSAAFGYSTTGKTLVGDPGFKNPAKGDFRLRSLSPCRDAGSGLPASTVDLLGNPRVNGKAIDIGCYEAQETSATTLMLR